MGVTKVLCTPDWSSTLSVFLCFFVIVDLLVSAQEPLVHNIGNPSLDFRKHAVIKPKIYYGREKRQISTTQEAEGHHTHDLTIGYNIDGEDYLLDLRLNRELIPDNFFVKYQHQGKHVVNRPTEKDLDLCQYVGVVRGIKESWVAISTCYGLQGVIYDGVNMHYLHAGDNDNNIEAPHFLYKHEDLISNHTCGYVGNVQHHKNKTDHLAIDKGQNEFNRILRYKRSAETKATITGPYNANKNSRYVELVLVVDNKEYRELDSDLNKVYHHCKDISNIINSLYAPLNIYIALVGVVVWSEYDEIPLSKNGDTTLTSFLNYRRQHLVGDHPNDNAQLLTRVEFEGGVVGKALKGPICTFEYSGGVAMDHSNVVGLVATTIAHEMGHNFGMEHDTEDCSCPDERCIMSPSSNSQSPTHWSSCSLEYLALAFERGMDYCLKNKPKQLFGSPVCGNGFVEPGEQCDCGLSRNCENNHCCDPLTCMLFPNATCATGECCDLNTCRPSTAGKVCREADHECDLPEYCTGQSEFCPDDVFKMDTERCDGGEAFCYHGSCRTRSVQCRLLWGPTGETSDDKCYGLNKKGTRHGNCGYNKLKQQFFPCSDEDIFCGMLQCRHLNERLEFGMESVSILSHTFINNNGSIIPCRTAIVDLGLSQIDPGLVPNGAKCGDGKMCVNQKCVAVASLMQSVQATPDSTVVCPNDCSGRGVCNSLGRCHCNKGFGPPECEYPGPGGSYDSGPASDPNAYRDWYMLLIISFSGIITTVLLLALLTYYSLHNTIVCWSSSKAASSKSPTKAGIQHRFSRGPSCLGLYSPSNSIPTTVSPTTPRTSPDDMNSSLLPSQNSSNDQPSQNNNFFGHFKGFTLAPLQKQEESFGVQNNNFGIENEQSTPFVSTFGLPISPTSQGNTSSVKNAINKLNNLNTNHTAQINANKSGNFINSSLHSPSQNQKVPQRSAPPIPSVPSVAIKLPNSHRSNTQPINQNKQTVTLNRSATAASDARDGSKSILSGIESSNVASMAPALPPNNSSTNSTRPIISNPILEASTCTAKELISPLKHSGGSVTVNKVPLRAAPSIPTATSPTSNKRPLSSPNSVTNAVNINEEQPIKKPKEGISLNRIASFLKQEKGDKDKSRNPVERSNSLPKNPNHQVKSFKNMDKNTLKNLKISNPILLSDIDLPKNTVPVISDSDDLDDTSKMVIMRAQSMRGPPSPTKPNVQAFGSMRQTSGTKRPTSIPVANRPTSPPPPRPDMIFEQPGNVKNKTGFFHKLPSLPGYQNPSSLDKQRASSFNKSNDSKSPEYDDCVAETHAPLANIREEISSDNIYAIIEESPPHNSVNKTFNKPLPAALTKNNVISHPGDSSKQTVGSTSASSDSIGLLGEIVSEIENRNLESIYSSSTLARKKKDQEGKNKHLIASDDETDFDDSSSTYGNSQYKSNDNEYSNVNGVKSISSAASTTSSGYLNPAVVNVPVHRMISTTDTNNSNTINASDDKGLKNSIKPAEKLENPFKPYVSTLNRPLGPFASSYNKDKSLGSNPESEQKSIGVSKVKSEDTSKTDIKPVPPNVKEITQTLKQKIDDKPKSYTTPTNKTKNIVASKNSIQNENKLQLNSPDLVSSCATNLKSIKSPDIVNSNGNPISSNFNSKVSAVNQGVILKPTLPTMNSNRGISNQNQKSLNTTGSKPAFKQNIKTPNSLTDSSKPILRSAPPIPANSNVNEKKKNVPPRPSLPKMVQKNLGDKSSSNSSLSSSKSNSIEKNLSNVSKGNNSGPDKHKLPNKTNFVRKNSDSGNKTHSSAVISNINPKPSNVANLQQKFEPLKNGNKVTTTTN